MNIEIDTRETGLRIYKLREQAGLSVNDLQNIFDFGTPQAIYKWQYGACLPSLSHLVNLARVFGVSVEDILVVKEV